jgi:hypothetical protein
LSIKLVDSVTPWKSGVLCHLMYEHFPIFSESSVSILEESRLILNEVKDVFAKYQINRLIFRGSDVLFTAHVDDSFLTDVRIDFNEFSLFP